MDDRISKLPKWAQTYISELEQRTIQAEEYADALRLMLDGSPTVEPNLSHPEGATVTGWKAYRIPKSCPVIEETTTSHYSSSMFLFSSPTLALRSLLPKILKAYGEEMAATVKLIKEYEN